MQLAEELLGLTAAKTELSRRVQRLQSGEIERVVLMRQSSPVAVILTVEEYERMRQAAPAEELLEDIKLLIAALENDDGTRTTLKELKAQLGI